MLKCNNVLFYKVTRQNSGIRNANAERFCCLVLTYILWGGSRNVHLPLICYRYTVFGCVALWLQGQVQYIPVWKHRATPLSASPFSPRAGLAFRFLGHKPPSLSRVCVCVCEVMPRTGPQLKVFVYSAHVFCKHCTGPFIYLCGE